MDVKLYYTIQYHTKFSMLTCAGRDFKGQPAASPSQRGGVPAFRQIFGTAHLCPYSSTYRATKFGLETLVAEARVSKVSHSPHSSGGPGGGDPGHSQKFSVAPIYNLGVRGVRNRKQNLHSVCLSVCTFVYLFSVSVIVLSTVVS